MKKILFVLMLCMIPQVFASTIFDDWVQDQESFNAGGHSFLVQYIESSQNVIFKMDNTGGLMNLGECETRDEIKYCFEDVDFPSIKVFITSMEPDVSIERSFSTAKPALNEEITVTVTLVNNGDKRASDVKYSDAYPAGLAVLSAANTWTGSLAPQEAKSFTYTIRAQDIISYDSKASLSYTFGGVEKKKQSEVVKVTVQKPYIFAGILSAEAADKNEIVIYNLSIHSEANKLTVENLEITFPSKISIVSTTSGLTAQDNVARFSGTIEGSKDFIFKIRSASVGKYTIKVKSSIKSSSKVFNEEAETTLSVGLSDIVPILNVSEEVTGNSPASVYAAIQNFGKTEIENVQIKLESGLFETVNVKRDIKPGDKVEVYKKTVTTPYVEEDKTYVIKLSGSYLSASGKTYAFEKESILKVSAPPQIISIARHLDKEEFSPGEEIKVEVTVRNQKAQKIDEVDVTDTFPKEIRSSLQGEVTNFFESLGPNEEKKAYSYSLKVPEDYSKSEIEFKTTINAKYNGELVILKRIDNIKINKAAQEPAQADEEIELAEVAGNESAPDQEAIRSRSGFFKRMISWFKNLF